MTTPATPPVLAVPGASAALSDRLQEGLTAVDALIREVVDHDDPFIAGASGHLVEAGGKRFRPLLTLLAAEVGGGINERVVHAAAGVELTHLASLYHDDVMDEATVRRGVTAVNRAYDNSTAILVGDLLFGKASELVAGLGDEAVLIQAQTFVRLCAGQIRDDRPCPAGEDPVAYYLDVLADKTGALIGTAGRYGAMFSGAPQPVITILREYGERLGVVFQLADDLIDVASGAEQMGKEPGTDLRAGVDTLVTLRAKELADVDDPDDARLLELLAADLSADEAGVAEALALLRRHPAMDRARAETEGVARGAQTLLDPLPDSDAKAALSALAVSVVQRTG